MAVDAMLVVAKPQDSGNLQSLSAEEFLRTVGRRVRQHRSRSRMSRKRLAELSGVSERYLAQLEAGQGNMSIILLRRVSTAISLPLDILMSDQGPMSSQSRSAAVVETRQEAPVLEPLQGSSSMGPLQEPSLDSVQETTREPAQSSSREPLREPCRESIRHPEFG